MLEEVARLLVKLLKVIEVVVLRGVGNGQEVVSSKNFKTKIFKVSFLGMGKNKFFEYLFLNWEVQFFYSLF